MYQIKGQGLLVATLWLEVMTCASWTLVQADEYWKHIKISPPYELRFLLVEGFSFFNKITKIELSLKLAAVFRLFTRLFVLQ